MRELNLATYHCQQTFFQAPFAVTSVEHSRESITIFSFENPWPNLVSWDILVWFQVSGIYISIDFPLKKIHIHFGDFIIPKNRCFFLRNIENYTSPDVFSPRKKPRNPFVPNPDLFSIQRIIQKAADFLLVDPRVNPLLGYPNHFASRQLKWCRPQREAQPRAHGRPPTDSSMWFGWGSGRPNIWSQGSGSNTLC